MKWKTVLLSDENLKVLLGIIISMSSELKNKEQRDHRPCYLGTNLKTDKLYSLMIIPLEEQANISGPPTQRRDITTMVSRHLSQDSLICVQVIHVVIYKELKSFCFPHE